MNYHRRSSGPVQRPRRCSVRRCKQERLITESMRRARLHLFAMSNVSRSWRLWKRPVGIEAKQLKCLESLPPLFTGGYAITTSNVGISSSQLKFLTCREEVISSYLPPLFIC